MPRDTKEDYYSLYVRISGCWSPEGEQEKRIGEEYRKGRYDLFVESFSNELKDLAIELLKSNEYIKFAEVFLRHQEVERMTRYLEEFYDPNDPQNFIYFRDLVFECLIDKKKEYGFLLARFHDDKGIVDKLKNNLEDDLYQSNFRELLVDVSFKDIEEFDAIFAADY